MCQRRVESTTSYKKDQLINSIYIAYGVFANTTYAFLPRTRLSSKIYAGIIESG